MIVSATTEPVLEGMPGAEPLRLVTHQGETVVLFCVLRPGVSDDDGLRSSISSKVVEQMGKPLKPETVVIVPALPKTRSGKVMRRVARAAWLGSDPGDLSALDNPIAVERIREAGVSAGR